MEAHVAPAWPGNSVAVVVRHYLQVTEDHFKQATEKSDAESDATRTPTPSHYIWPSTRDRRMACVAHLRCSRQRRNRSMGVQVTVSSLCYGFGLIGEGRTFRKVATR